MRTFKILLLALLPLLVAGQTRPITGTVDLSDYPTRAEMNAAIQAAKLGTAPPVVALPYCGSGPDVRAILDASATGLSFNFWAQGVGKIAWKITNSTDTISIRRGAVIPQNDKPRIAFAALPNGSYRLIIDGVECKNKLGASAFSFTLGSTGVADPPTVDPPITEPVDWSVKRVASGMPDDINPIFERVPGGAFITDEATSLPPNGYEFWYQINSEIVKSKTRLKRYLYASTAPIRIVLMQGRDGLDTFNRWENEPGGYYSSDAGKTFASGTEAAFYTAVFTGTDNDFYNPIPANYNPSNAQTQWMDVVQPIRLPKGQILVTPRGEWNGAAFMKHGPSHLSIFQRENSGWNSETDARLYSEVIRPEYFLKLPDTGVDKWVDSLGTRFNKRHYPTGPLTDQDAINKANDWPVWGLVINETMEGNSWTPSNNPQWRPYYTQFRKRQIEAFDSKGIPSFVAHDYGSPDAKGIRYDRAESKAVGRNPALKYGLFIDGPLSPTNLITAGVYIKAPDLEIGVVQDVAYKMIIAKAIGKASVSFTFPVHEWHENHFHRVDYEDGSYFQKEKLPIDPNALIGISFVSGVFGNGSVVWGEQGKNSGRGLDPNWKSHVWVPKVSGAPYTHSVQQKGGFYVPYSGGADFLSFGTRMYSETFGLVDGGVGQYLKFRVDDGAWVEPSQLGADEMVDSYYDKRGFAYARVKDGKTAWFYLNCWADNLQHKLEVELPDGRRLVKLVSTNAVHVQLI